MNTDDGYMSSIANNSPGISSDNSAGITGTSDQYGATGFDPTSYAGQQYDAQQQQQNDPSQIQIQMQWEVDQQQQQSDPGQQQQQQWSQVPSSPGPQQHYTPSQPHYGFQPQQSAPAAVPPQGYGYSPAGSMPSRIPPVFQQQPQQGPYAAGQAPPRYHQGYAPSYAPSAQGYPSAPPPVQPAYGQPGPAPPGPGGYHPNPVGVPPYQQVMPAHRPVPGVGSNMNPLNQSQSMSQPGTLFHNAMLRPELGPPVPWTTDIFGFLQDCYGCPLVVIAPCIAFGQIAEITDTGYNSCQTATIIYALALSLGIPCLYSYTYRSKMRHKFNLREDPMDDFCLHFWCECCALAQEYRELAYRGIDPSLGYAVQQAVVNQAMLAPVAPRMQK